MKKTNKKQGYEDKILRNERRVYEAWQRLSRTPLAMLRDISELHTGTSRETGPETAILDPSKRLLWCNVERDHTVDQWRSILAHLLLQMGLNHVQKVEARDPFLWNLACSAVADELLPLFSISPVNSDDSFPAAGSEEHTYDQLVESIHQRKSLGLRAFDSPPKTLAGPHKPHILGLGKPALRDLRAEEALAEGIRMAVEEAILNNGNREDSSERGRSWAPAERAKQWVMNAMPLIGALAAELTNIADASLCDRMDIHIAAVNPWLMEIYWKPGWNLSQDEVNFIYAHELLHVALLHHSRLEGRDPQIWNLACDFVINGWLTEMGIGTAPTIGLLYDPRLKGLSAETVYDMLIADPKRCKGLRGFRGRLGDILLDQPGRTIFRSDVTTLDDIIRRCLGTGMMLQGRGSLPAGLEEEVRALFTPPVPWDVALARWMDAHVPSIRDPLRTYARASRRQSSTPDIPRPARFVPQEWRSACTFGVVLDTSGSMNRELLGRALGAIASYAEARGVEEVRLVMCDATPYDRGLMDIRSLRGVVPIKGRGGTVLQPAINLLLSRPEFPATAPIMIITDGWCEEELTVPREHCFLLPRKSWKEGGVPLRTSSPVFRVLKESWEE